MQIEEIPVLLLDNGNVLLHPVSDTLLETEGPLQPFTDIHLCWIEFREGGRTSFLVSPDQNVLLYAVKVEVAINETDVRMMYRVEFANNDGEIRMKANTDGVILFGYETLFNKPFVAHGPFLINTREEIMQAYDDYNKGLFGDPEAL